MLICHVDESGDTGALVPTERNTQPVLLISAVIAKQSSLKQLTRSMFKWMNELSATDGNDVLATRRAEVRNARRCGPGRSG